MSTDNTDNKRTIRDASRWLRVGFLVDCESSGGTGRRDPEHVCDPLVELLALLAMEVNVPPGVVEGSDHQARQVTGHQVQHVNPLPDRGDKGGARGNPLGGRLSHPGSTR